MRRLATAKVEDLTALSGVGEKTAEKIIEAAQAYLARKAESEALGSEETSQGGPSRPTESEPIVTGDGGDETAAEKPLDEGIEKEETVSSEPVPDATPASGEAGAPEPHE